MFFISMLFQIACICLGIYLVITESFYEGALLILITIVAHSIFSKLPRCS